MRLATFAIAPSLPFLFSPLSCSAAPALRPLLPSLAFPNPPSSEPARTGRRPAGLLPKLFGFDLSAIHFPPPCILASYQFCTGSRSSSSMNTPLHVVWLARKWENHQFLLSRMIRSKQANHRMRTCGREIHGTFLQGFGSSAEKAGFRISFTFGLWALATGQRRQDHSFAIRGGVEWQIIVWDQLA